MRSLKNPETAGSVLASLSLAPQGDFAFTLLPGSTPGFAVNAANQLVATTAPVVGSTSVLLVHATGTLGTFDTTITVRNGTTASNTISGDATRDIAYGNAGNDTIDGAGGNDVLYGQAGRDTINGGDGNDIIDGGVANDTLFGGAGADRFRYVAGDGVDVIDGGDGLDRLELIGTAAANSHVVTWDGAQLAVTGQTLISVEEVSVDLAGGVDRITYLIPLGFGIDIDMAAPTLPGFKSVANVEEVVTAAGDDRFHDAAGSQLLDGRAGNDLFVVVADNAADRFNGSVGLDTVDYSGFSSNLSFNLALPTLVIGSGATSATSDTLDAIDNVVSGSGNDQITGSAGINNLIGGAGDDVISAGNQNDLLTGGA
ncbi:Ca2+-binding RTX toxin-like protein [Sphingomonas yantingensis]|uniref:Ca2+-binding RTX toxin-like protein n=1 Tax=Sphingomonas yantingensis TaxID=1241761 RepID=A0A7W9EJ99_9SPHN|nr:Ca2+-binding RTX toxin-like protein [Sphingomonas yantingensis]